MKSLKSRLQRIELPRYYGDRTLEEYCDVNDIDIDNITESQLHMYSDIVYGRERSHHALLNHINEMLKSHDGTELANKILQVIDGDAYDSGIHHIENCVISIYVDPESPIISDNSTIDFFLNDCPESDKIYDLLDYYGYYITSIDYIRSSNKYEITIEPKYTKEYNNESGIYYHITTEKNLPNILRKGLRPHVGKARIQGGYRYFTKRLFLIPDSPTVYDDIKNVINDKGYKNFVILRIDGDLYSGHKNKLATFIDDYSFNANDVYTYEYIPKEAISIVDLESLK